MKRNQEAHFHDDYVIKHKRLRGERPFPTLKAQIFSSKNPIYIRLYFYHHHHHHHYYHHEQQKQLCELLYMYTELLQTAAFGMLRRARAGFHALNAQQYAGD